MSEEHNIELARKMIYMHANHLEGWVDACYHPDCEWIELPIPGQLKGRSGDAAAMKKAADASASLFPNIDITINNLMSDGDKVAMEVDFVGTTAPKKGTSDEGKTTTVKMAIFLTIRDGLISRQVDYLVPVS